MTLEDLRAFVAAYDAKSMSEAARIIGCTQGAVAQHVRRLEQELGTELFMRLRRGVSPTQSGDVLYEAARSALATLDQASQDIERSLKLSESRLRLTTSTGIVSRYLRVPIVALKARKPTASIEIESEDTTAGRLAALRDGRADLALVPLTEPITGLEVRPGGRTALALLVHRDHPFASRKQLELSDLATIRYLAQAPSSGTYRHVERALRAVGITLVPSQIVEDAATANLMVELDHGETFVPAALGATFEQMHRVKAVAVPSLPPLQMGWVARNFSLLPSVALEFMALCEEIDRTQKAARPKVVAKAAPVSARRLRSSGTT